MKQELPTELVDLAASAGLGIECKFFPKEQYTSAHGDSYFIWTWRLDVKPPQELIVTHQYTLEKAIAKMTELLTNHIKRKAAAKEYEANKPA